MTGAPPPGRRGPMPARDQLAREHRDPGTEFGIADGTALERQCRCVGVGGDLGFAPHQRDAARRKWTCAPRLTSSTASRSVAVEDPISPTGLVASRSTPSATRPNASASDSIVDSTNRSALYSMTRSGVRNPFSPRGPGRRSAQDRCRSDRGTTRPVRRGSRPVQTSRLGPPAAPAEPGRSASGRCGAPD